MLEQCQTGEGPDISHVDWTKIAVEKNSLPQLLDHCEKLHADRELVVFDDRRISYGDAAAAARRLSAGLLQAGVGKGQRIGIMLPNSPEFAITWFAVAQIGAVAVPISTLASPVELRHIFAGSSISLLIARPDYLGHDLIGRIEQALAGPAGEEPLPFLRDVWLWDGGKDSRHDNIETHLRDDEARVRAAMQSVAPADLISIIYTSGSTSLPKGVIHSHATFLRSAQRWTASMDYRHGDRVYNSAPFFWVGGLVTGLLTVMEVGATLIGCSYGGAAMADFIVAERCTLLATSKLIGQSLKAVPGIHERDFSALRGGSVPEFLPQHLRTRNQIYFGNALGMTETAGPHTLALPDVDDAHIGSMGPLAPGMQHRIIDRNTGQDVPSGERGELLVRGDTLMLGYVGQEPRDVLDTDGWFHTGDICSYRDGHLFLHGRIDNLIKVSGANVAPAEVEAALVTLDGVEAAFAAGFTDSRRGQVVGALVKLMPGARLDPDDAIRALRARLAPYKVPRLLVLADALPLTATSKIDQRAAKAMIRDGINVLAANVSHQSA